MKEVTPPLSLCPHKTASNGMSRQKKDINKSVNITVTALRVLLGIRNLNVIKHEQHKFRLKKIHQARIVRILPFFH